MGVGGWYRVGVGVWYRVGVGGWYRVGVGGIGWGWVGGIGFYQIIIFKDMDVVSVDMQPCLDALVGYF